MYCKNCGRQLKEGMRFCDRCGQSVRKSQQSGKSAKRQEIEELKAERLNRKKRLAEKEARQYVSKKRKKKKGNTFMFIVILILIAVLSVIIGYNIFPKGGNVAQPTVSPNGTASSTAPVSSPSVTGGTVKNGYAVLTIGNVTCPYPSDFHSNTVSGSEKLNMTDPLGGATMIVAQEGKGGVPKDMMIEYAAQSSNVSYSRAGGDWYAITFEADEKIKHRKCIVRNGISIYYDFTYDASSSSSKRYQEYIDYIDSNFK
jgi:predicted nucleic acid-binding Zn ribbon protein